MQSSEPQVFNGRYRIDERIASGGMAIVYGGTDTLLRRRVAIKVLRDQYASDDDFVRRFSYEAQAAAKLSHPNIVAVYDFGREDHAYYIVMELVDGETLGEMIRDERALPEPVAVDYAAQIASGLAFAHRGGLLHRDVKPANVLVTQDDVVKLSDFGIARAVSENTIGVTQPGMVMGSVAYISPEQAQGRDLDERSDLYSVGVVLYQMLTGRLPFTGDSPVAVALKHVSEPAPPIDTAATGVSPAIASIVARLLQKDPQQRFSSASELATALREAREQPAPTPSRRGSSIADAPTTTIPVVPQPPPRRSAAPDRAPDAEVVEVVDRPAVPRNAMLAIIIVLGLLAAILGYVFARNPLGAPAKTIALPDLRNKSATQAQEQLLALGIHPTVTEEASPDVAPGRVTRQDPPPATKLAPNDPVTLWVSNGPPMVDVPDVKGYTLADAQRVLANAHLKSVVVSKYGDQPAGTVVDVQPGNGRKARMNSAVTLVVSKGKQPASVPSVVSLTVEAARSALAQAGLKLDVVQRAPSESIPVDTIVSQDPKEGSAVAPGSTVSVVVSSGAQPVPVPDVGGKSPEEAQSTMRGAGFEPTITYNVEPANASGNVTAQNPAPGTNAPRGSKITLVISVPGTVPDVSGLTLDDAKRAIVQAGYQIGNVALSTDGEEGKVVRSEPEANTTLRPGESVTLYYHQAAPK